MEKIVGEKLHPPSHLFNATYPSAMSTIQTGLHLLFVLSGRQHFTQHNLIRVLTKRNIEYINVNSTASCIGLIPV